MPLEVGESRTSNQGSGTLVGLMGFTMLFALLGDEIRQVQQNNGNPVANAPGILSSGATIIVGGVAATSLLVLLSHAGDAGEQLATGLALVTFVTVALVSGGPVWSALGNTVGGKGTKDTTPTGNTTPSASTPAAAGVITTAIA